MPINFYQGPGQLYSTRDVEQRNPFTETLARLTQERRDAQSQQNLADMAAQRMSALGPQGQYWAEQIKRDPRAALALAGQYGGFAEIENSILGARKAGEAQMQLGQLQQRGASPQQIVDFILRTQGPDAASKAASAFGALTPTSQGPAEYETADGVYIRDPNEKGGYRFVGKAPAKTPLVQIGESGLKPEQAIAAEDRAASQVDSRIKPLQDALDAWDGFRAVYEKIATEGRDPTAAETDTLIKLAARLENPESVQEGDIARKSGGGPMNWARGLFNQPYQIDREWMEGLKKTGETIAAAKRKRLAEIQSRAQEVASERGLSARAVSPAGREDQPPAGSVKDPNVPGVWITPDGEYWVP